MDLVLRNKITIDKPDNIRPFIEFRAGCGSRMARAYVLEHWHETPTQIPDFDYQNHLLSECGPAGPEDREDREDGHVMTDTRRRERDQQLAEFYRRHPEEDPKVKQQKAEEGGAIVLGALLIHAMAMPATGPGSIACNKYTNGYPGYTDPSVCNEPTPAK